MPNSHYPGLMPRFYGKPIDCPLGHKWSGYAEDAPGYVRPTYSTGDPVNRQGVVTALLAATDGATIESTGLPYRGHGIIVAVTGYERQLSADANHAAGLPGDVRQWVDSVAPIVSGTHLRPRAFGVLHFGGTMYLDVVEVFPADQRDEAVAAGRLRGEIAVWDAGRNEEIPTGAEDGAHHRLTSDNPDDFTHPVEVDGTNLWRQARVDPGF